MIIRKKYKEVDPRGTITEEITLTHKEELIKVFKELSNEGYRWNNGDSLNDINSFANLIVMATLTWEKCIKIYLLDNDTILFKSNCMFNF